MKSSIFSHNARSYWHPFFRLRHINEKLHLQIIFLPKMRHEKTKMSDRHVANLRLVFIVGAIAAFGAAAPTFSQMLEPNVGTGNIAACYYDQNDVLQAGIPGVDQFQFAVPKSGASAFAEAPEMAADSHQPGAHRWRRHRLQPTPPCILIWENGGWPQSH